MIAGGHHLHHGSLALSPHLAKMQLFTWEMPFQVFIHNSERMPNQIII